jgi:hypothetical protein
LRFFSWRRRPNISGISTFSKAVICGSRLKFWKTKPTPLVPDLRERVLVEPRDLLAAQGVRSRRTACRGNR